MLLQKAQGIVPIPKKAFLCLNLMNWSNAPQNLLPSRASPKARVLMRSAVLVLPAQLASDLDTLGKKAVELDTLALVLSADLDTLGKKAAELDTLARFQQVVHFQKVAQILLSNRCFRSNRSLFAGRFLPDSRLLQYAADFPERIGYSSRLMDLRSDHPLLCSCRQRTRNILLHKASLQQFWHCSWKGAELVWIPHMHKHRHRRSYSSRCSNTAEYASR